jgi:[glutamine synthetase] adenylyltransferase / [glutamine synthetase]-adenylyl-L-tyrosine phosphorylase
MAQAVIKQQNMKLSWQRAITVAQRHAPFLHRLLADMPDLPDELARDGADRCFGRRLDRLKRARSKKLEKTAIAALLRRTRSEVALLVALADLAGAWSIEQSALQLSRFAELAIDLALRTAMAPLLARGTFNGTDYDSCGLTCLALGKLGAGELNYSSDVDLIFLFDEQKLTTSDGDDPLDLLLRAVRDFTDILQTADQNGYVLRVDLRLRPDPNATPAVLSMAAADIYYQSAALTWERAAFTRARAIAGDVAAGEAFLQRLSSWIWRRSLDFTAIRDIHDLRLHMADHFGQEEFLAPGFDLKRGHGGIREVEFILQMHQLIHGGRLPALRHNNTLKGLQCIVDLELMPKSDIARLQKNYRWLRRTEHRLQMMQDAQTHVIPADTEQRLALAHLCGYRTCASFEKQMQQMCSQVHAVYERLTQSRANVAQGFSHDDARLAQQLVALGFGAHAANLIQQWRSQRFRALRTPRAQAALEALLPELLVLLAKSPEPDIVLARVNDMLERLPSGVQFLELLDTNRKLLDLLARVLLHSPAWATRLAQHPDLLDAVFDAQFFSPPPAAATLCADLDGLLGANHDESQIEKIARWQAEKQFQVAVLVIDSLIDGRAAARLYAWIMDAVVSRVAHIAAAAFERRHGRVPGGELVLLALGGWGGEALMPTSDLDCICLFTGAYDAQSTGHNSLSATHYFNRLAQRVISYLSAQSAYGPMAEIDVRLRPSGNQGLLCVNIQSFAEYQQSQAWTWEHLALTRARCIYGPGDAAMAAAMTALQTPRPLLQLQQDARNMRRDIAEHKPPQGPFDFKLMPGGLIDIEFIAHVCQLHAAAAHPKVILPAIDAALIVLGDVGALPATDASSLAKFYNQMIAARLWLSLCADGDATQAPVANVQQPMLAQMLGVAQYAQIDRRLAKNTRQVTNIWSKIFNIKMEHDDGS